MAKNGQKRPKNAFLTRFLHSTPKVAIFKFGQKIDFLDFFKSKIVFFLDFLKVSKSKLVENWPENSPKWSKMPEKCIFDPIFALYAQINNFDFLVKKSIFYIFSIFF